MFLIPRSPERPKVNKNQSWGIKRGGEGKQHWILINNEWESMRVKYNRFTWENFQSELLSESSLLLSENSQSRKCFLGKFIYFLLPAWSFLQNCGKGALCECYLCHSSTPLQCTHFRKRSMHLSNSYRFKCQLPWRSGWARSVLVLVLHLGDIGFDSGWWRKICNRGWVTGPAHLKMSIAMTNKCQWPVPSIAI